MIGGHFFQRLAEGRAVAGDFRGVGVRLEFVAARPGVGEHAEHLADGFQQDAEKDQSDVRGNLIHPEGVEQQAGEFPVGIGGETQQEEDHRGLQDAHGEALLDVAAAEMADFMGEHAEQFRLAAFLDQCVEQGDFLALAEAGEKRVRLGRAFGAVHHEYSGQREAAFFAERFDFLFQLAIRHGRELVEQRHDQRRREVGEDQLEGGHHGPRPQPGVGDVAENPQHRGPERQADHGGEHQTLEPVHDEGGGRGAVESEFLLDDEGVINRERQGNQALAEEQQRQENQARDHGRGRERARQPVQPAEAAQRPECQQHHQRDRGLEDVETGVDPQVVARLVEFFLIHQAFQGLGDGGRECL